MRQGPAPVGRDEEPHADYPGARRDPPALRLFPFRVPRFYASPTQTSAAPRGRCGCGEASDAGDLPQSPAHGGGVGTRVYRGAQKEIGWGPISLTDDGARSALAPLCRAEPHVLHWHSETFELPTGATRLAFNENYENQAFSYGRNALGLQFHLEAGSLELEEWYVAMLRSSRVPDCRSARCEKDAAAARQPERPPETCSRHG
jgi:hypothetical protein